MEGLRAPLPILLDHPLTFPGEQTWQRLSLTWIYWPLASGLAENMSEENFPSPFEKTTLK